MLSADITIAGEYVCAKCAVKPADGQQPPRTKGATNRRGLRGRLDRHRGQKPGVGDFPAGLLVGRGPSPEDQVETTRTTPAPVHGAVVGGKVGLVGDPAALGQGSAPPDLDRVKTNRATMKA